MLGKFLKVAVHKLCAISLSDSVRGKAFQGGGVFFSYTACYLLYSSAIFATFQCDMNINISSNKVLSLVF